MTGTRHSPVAILEVYTREGDPFPWAAVQQNLGTTLLNLGKRENGISQLEQTVTAYRAALEVYARDGVAFHWAATQKNGGKALQALGRRESGNARLEHAEEAFLVAFEVFIVENMPEQRLVVLENLKRTRSMLRERRVEPKALAPPD